MASADKNDQNLARLITVTLLINAQVFCFVLMFSSSQIWESVYYFSFSVINPPFQNKNKKTKNANTEKKLK